MNNSMSLVTASAPQANRKSFLICDNLWHPLFIRVNSCQGVLTLNNSMSLVIAFAPQANRKSFLICDNLWPPLFIREIRVN